MTVYSVIDHGANMFACTNDAVFRSSDGGASWAPTAGQPGGGTEFTTVAIIDQILYAGTFGTGLFASSDAGLTWYEVNEGLSGWAKNIVSIVALGDSLYIGTQGAGIYVRHRTEGEEWTAMNAGLDQAGVTALIATGDRLVAGVGMYGYTWKRGEAAWTSLPLDAERTQLEVKSIHATDRYIYVGTTNGVYRGSTDATGWKLMEIKGLPNRSVDQIVSVGSRIYAGVRYHDEHFLWSTDDDGANWDIRAHEYSVLFNLHVALGRIWAGRLDGLWSADLSTWTSVEETPVVNTTTTLAPQPVTDHARITFIASAPSHTTIELVNAAGSIVGTIYDASVDVGEHHATVDTSSLPVGLYALRIRTGESVSITPMVKSGL